MCFQGRPLGNEQPIGVFLPGEGHLPALSHTYSVKALFLKYLHLLIIIAYKHACVYDACGPGEKKS